MQLENFFESGDEFTPSCQTLIKTIFTRDLIFDGFAYPYNATSFSACKPSSDDVDTNRAIVVTSDAWITPENVKFYTSLSTSELENRTRIQTLFLTATEWSHNDGSQLIDGDSDKLDQAIQAYFDKHDNLGEDDAKFACDDATCTVTVSACDDSDNCRQIKFGPYTKRTFPTTITQTEGGDGYGYHRLLWSDLDGKPKTKNINAWLRAHRFACTSFPYQASVVKPK